ncbi:hypothetical protein [Streptococcus sp. zg-JUN1979]|uniref:hypothetical protein n=1 Tax=Streptococcus sp. zg-JUN1979 TaxID=3391450 RepID=UPI0039A6A392
MEDLEKTYELILDLVAETLQKGEKLLVKTSIGKRGSFYIVVLRDRYYYKVLRFSDHKATVPYLAVPTIDYKGSNRQTLRARIDKSLNESWTRFSFESYQALKVIEKWSDNRVQLFYQDAYRQRTFKKRTFYLREDYARDNKRVYLSESIAKELRRLLVTGVINIRRELASRDHPLYITDLSQAFLNTFERLYETRWKEKEQQMLFRLPHRAHFDGDVWTLEARSVVEMSYHCDVERFYPLQEIVYMPYLSVQKSSFLKKLKRLVGLFRTKFHKADQKVVESAGVDQDLSASKQLAKQDDKLKLKKASLPPRTQDMKAKAIKKRHMLEITGAMSQDSLDKLQALKDSFDQSKD